MAPEPMNFSCSLSGTIDPLQNPRFDFSTPLERIDTTKIHLYAKVDTTWYKSDFLFNQLPGKLRQYQMTKNGNWIPGTQYSLEIDSAAFTDIYGKVSSAFKQGFKVRSLDEYGSLQVTLPGMKDTTCVVQLLNMSGKIAMEETTRTASSNSSTSQPTSRSFAVVATSLCLLILTVTVFGTQANMLPTVNPKWFISIPNR